MPSFLSDYCALCVIFFLMFDFFFFEMLLFEKYVLHIYKFSQWMFDVFWAFLNGKLSKFFLLVFIILCIGVCYFCYFLT